MKFLYFFIAIFMSINSYALLSLSPDQNQIDGIKNQATSFSFTLNSTLVGDEIVKIFVAGGGEIQNTNCIGPISGSCDVTVSNIILENSRTIRVYAWDKNKNRYYANVRVDVDYAFNTDFKDQIEVYIEGNQISYFQDEYSSYYKSPIFSSFLGEKSREQDNSFELTVEIKNISDGKLDLEVLDEESNTHKKPGKHIISDGCSIILNPNNSCFVKFTYPADLYEKDRLAHLRFDVRNKRFQYGVGNPLINQKSAIEALAIVNANSPVYTFDDYFTGYYELFQYKQKVVDPTHHYYTGYYRRILGFYNKGNLKANSSVGQIVPEYNEQYLNPAQNYVYYNKDYSYNFVVAGASSADRPLYNRLNSLSPSERGWVRGINTTYWTRSGDVFLSKNLPITDSLLNKNQLYIKYKNEIDECVKYDNRADFTYSSEKMTDFNIVLQSDFPNNLRYATGNGTESFSLKCIKTGENFYIFGWKNLAKLCFSCNQELTASNLSIYGQINTELFDLPYYLSYFNYAYNIEGKVNDEDLIQEEHEEIDDLLN